MDWISVLITFSLMVLGYLIGSYSSAIFISKRVKKEDIRKKGSGNAGATNTLRNYGKKWGLVVFSLDVLKPIVAMMIAWVIKTQTNQTEVIVPAVGLATVIGHIWPIYYNFKGGKGAACMLGFVIGTQWILAIIGFVLFMAIVLYTKKVSIGSIFTPLVLLIVFIALGATGTMQEAWSKPLSQTPDVTAWWIDATCFGIIWIIVVFKHKANIKRLLNGTENSYKSSK